MAIEEIKKERCGGKNIPVDASYSMHKAHKANGSVAGYLRVTKQGMEKLKEENIYIKKSDRFKIFYDSEKNTIYFLKDGNGLFYFSTNNGFSSKSLLKYISKKGYYNFNFNHNPKYTFVLEGMT